MDWERNFIESDRDLKKSNLKFKNLIVFTEIKSSNRIDGFNDNALTRILFRFVNFYILIKHTILKTFLSMVLTMVSFFFYLSIQHFLLLFFFFRDIGYSGTLYISLNFVKSAKMPMKANLFTVNVTDKYWKKEGKKNNSVYMPHALRIIK